MTDIPTDLPTYTTNDDGKRSRAAPHIKTYIRYNGNSSIDWALLTSANLSKQAWGEAIRSETGEVRIASWEIGVLLWPDLLSEGSVMVPTFGTDNSSEVNNGLARTVTRIRIPYSMPLQRYGPNEKPWVATMDYAEPDHHGQVWMNT